MNKLLDALVAALRIRFLNTVTEVNYYAGENDDGERIIYINSLNSMAVPIKLLWGRPTHNDFTKAHEVGHAFFDAYNLENNKEARRLFGDFDQEYRETFGLLASVFHTAGEEYVTKYAVEHPIEDFADVFALLVVNSNLIPHWVKNEKMKKKFDFIQKRIAKLNLI